MTKNQMTKNVFLPEDFLFSEDVLPVQGDPTSYTWVSPYDMPDWVKMSSSDKELSLVFQYRDREVAGPEETALDESTELPIHVTRGQYSGKLMTLRVPLAKDVVSMVAERLKLVAPHQKRKNQELNFLLLSNILRKKQDEFQPV
ncbi:MAG: hypothetical protein L0241_27055 [Planctomycetia bacterium]|nr:hypothetical protein [Planctomycetia bacterium]